jgi:hypothetical protein
MRNRDIPAETDRRDTRWAAVLLVVVVLILAVWFGRPAGPRPDAGVIGVVESHTQLPNKWAPGGSYQWLKVRLADGRVVDATTARSPTIAEGERVQLRSATQGPFKYEAVPAAR